MGRRRLTRDRHWLEHVPKERPCIVSFARAGETHHKLCLENFVVPRSEITNKRVYAI